MRVFFVTSGCHHKNLFFMNKYLEKHHTIVNSIDDADIIYSPATYIDSSKYKDKFFIFGPHFSQFPNKVVNKFNNIHKNSIYIQPSQASVDTWTIDYNFTNIPVVAIPFGVDTEKFIQTINIRDKILLYYKDRNPKELNYLEQFLQEKNIQYKLFNYKQRYDSNEYLSYLKNCKYGIWLGSHESQGFALEEALACNVPLLVWNVKLRNQEWSRRKYYTNKQLTTIISTIPYWDERCGEFFYKQEDFEQTFEKFISKLNTYKPREYIMEILNVKKCGIVFEKLI